MTQEGRRWDGPRNLILTHHDSRVLVGWVEGALAFPLYDIVLQDGHKVGIFEFLEGGRGWGARTPESHVWEIRGHEGGRERDIHQGKLVWSQEAHKDLVPGRPEFSRATFFFFFFYRG